MLRVFSAFAGYGTDNFALKRLGIPFECVGFSEIDKYAIQCFSMNHATLNESLTQQWKENTYNAIPNYGDITKINPEELPDFDLFTGGFPCQAFSTAGKGLGELDPRGTLFYDIIRICEVKQPKWIFLENVKGLLSKKHKPTFGKIISELTRIGYTVQTKVLNTKKYGIPQNRERVFFVCKLEENVGGTEYPFKNSLSDFKWPEEEELKIFIKDILEPEVDQKYYLSEKQIRRLLESSDLKKHFSTINPEIGITMTSRQYANWKGNFVMGNVNPSGNGMNGEVIDANGIAPTLTTNKGDGTKIGYIQADVSGKGYNSQQDRIYDSDGVMCCLPNARPDNKINIIMKVGDRGKPTLSIKSDVANCLNANVMSDRQQMVMEPKIFASRGRNPVNPSSRESGLPTEQRMEFNTEGTSNALSTLQKDNLQVVNGRQSQADRIYNSEGVSPSLNRGWVPAIMEQYVFRRLTPKECFRLQGFLNDEVDLTGISDSQAYKLAGNGQSVNVVTKIFERMFK